ncbi:MAG: fused MFS/spermidine synthase [Nitrospiraceae bacterium]|nr:fused MFS/spermidine synthase [Nitrospiraceae bacterium]
MADAVRKGDTHPASFAAYLIVTAVLCGGLVMVIEVLGSRVIGPFFGVSLFVWTSLITVTLVSLATGYAAGGVLSDRRSSPDYLYGIIFAAGLLTLLVPQAKHYVLKSCMSLGLRSGALASSALLFGPALFLLGCVSPYVIKIAAREMKNIGRTVGIFYALSTAGSFIGTVLTGFVLIAYFRVGMIFEFIGFTLLLLSALYFVFFRRKWYVLPVLLLPLLLPIGGGRVQKTMADGTTVTRVFSEDSFYGNLKVVDYSYGPTHTREMIIDGLVQSGVDMRNGQSVYEYAYFMNFLPYGMNPDGRNSLVIGLGAGLIPRWFEEHGIATDVVDIDPKVADVAGRYFGFRNAGGVVISDARYFLATAAKKYDYIVVDVFNGDTTPGHLLSLEAFRLLRQRLTDRGVVAFNLIGSLRQPFVMASVVRTLKQVFRSVKIYPEFNPAEGGGCGNIAVVAYDAPSLSFDPARVRKFPIHPLAEAGVLRYLGKEYSFPEGTPAMVLSDDFNPVDVYDLRLKETVRKNILKNTDWDILI